MVQAINEISKANLVFSSYDGTYLDSNNTFLFNIYLIFVANAMLSSFLSMQKRGVFFISCSLYWRYLLSLR